MGSCYQPTSAETERVREIVAKVRPAYHEYEAYRARVRALRTTHGSRRFTMTFGRHEATITRLGLRTAYLFQQSHLLAEVPTFTFRRLAPATDAATRIATAPDGLPLPIVLIPSLPGWSQRNDLRSLVEGEFVHVNRWINGGSSMREVLPRTASELHARFVVDTAHEYEASLVRFTRWPRFFTEYTRMSLNLWCAVDGYTRALQRAVLDAAELEPFEVNEFLELLAESVEATLLPAALGQHEVASFEGHIETHVAKASRRVVEDVPEIDQNPAMKAVGAWITRGGYSPTNGARPSSPASSRETRPRNLRAT